MRYPSLSDRNDLDIRKIGVDSKPRDGHISKASALKMPLSSALMIQELKDPSLRFIKLSFAFFSLKDLKSSFP